MGRRFIRQTAPFLVSALIFAGALHLAGVFLGPELVPPPGAVLASLWEITRSGEVFHDISITVARALAGIVLANLAGIALGLAAGFAPGALRLVSPLVAALQSCPPVVWISLVMVWAGTGSPVPVATVFAAAFPFVFSAAAQGVMGLDRRIFAMSRLYDVPKTRVMRQYVLPGILPYWLASLSAVLATGWKAAAVAEFLGSHDGIGAKIFWSYRNLNMEELNAWALALIVFGVILECGLILPLRRRVAVMGVKGVADA
jgi:ABC-type nitrate/sulfonate/bicarbonate transport system permease component